jgi:LmbE family N-acetylglucosaminyl deacetylase
MKHSNILILAPHTDDGELGCGGTIAKFVEEGHNVICAAFSTAQDSLPVGFARDALKWEFIDAMNVLGVYEKNLRIFDYPVRIFSNYRQNILEDIVKLKNDINPDIVFLPSMNDIHQDHQVITAEGLRVFKKVSLLGYELPWNNIVFETRSFVKLNERHIIRKIDALKRYKSQNHRLYLNEDFIRGLARTRGTQFETDFAEAYEVLRFIIE